MGEVIVRSGEGLRQEVRMGEHRLTADEPVDLGGADAGPNPYELLMAALGACTSITIRMYAARKGWPLEGVEIRLAHDRIHATDCATCEEREGYLDRIRKEITVTGPLTPEQLERLADIAEKCPVNRTLHRTVVTEQVFHPRGAA